jgi:AcrR family transcriptional regulator
MTEVSSRLERKKRRTRALIRDTALELFAEHGYEATTIKAIADAADVAPRTVTLHFPAKDDLLFADEDPFRADRLAARLDQRAPGESALDALLDWMATTMRAAEAAPPEETQRFWRLRSLRARLIAGDDQLRGRARASYAATEHVLAAAIADDLGLPPDALAPRLAAQAAVIGLRELYESQEARAAGPEPTAADLLPLVEQVIGFVDGGLTAMLRSRRVP